MSTYIPSFFHSLKWWCGLVFEAPGSGSLTLLTLYWITSFCNIIVASVNLQSFPKLLSHLYWAESSKPDFGRVFKILIGSVPLAAQKKEYNLRTQSPKCKIFYGTPHIWYFDYNGGAMRVLLRRFSIQSQLKVEVLTSRNHRRKTLLMITFQDYHYLSWSWKRRALTGNNHWLVELLVACLLCYRCCAKVLPNDNLNGWYHHK